MLKKNLDETLFDHEKKINELSIRIETQDLNERDLLEVLNVTPEQLTTYVGSKENFKEEDWEALQKESEKLESKLTAEINSVANPQSTKKAYSEMSQIPRNALFMR